MLLAIFQIPADSTAFAHVAAAADMHIADVRHRLAGTLPRILLADTDGERVAAAATALATRGFSVAAIDPAGIPRDGQCIMARRLELGTDELGVIEGVGAEIRHVVPVSAILLVQRGRRVDVETETTETKERKLSAGRALASGGLLVHKTVKKTTTRTTEDHQSFARVQRSDGGQDVVLYEKKLDYRFLGSEMQPSSRGNFERTVVLLRALAPGAALDTRVSQPGFTNALGGFGVDPVDLGLHLVRLAYEHGYRA